LCRFGELTAFQGTNPSPAASLYEELIENADLEEGRPKRPVEVATETWDYGWQWRAACRGEDAALFFAPNHFETKDEKDARERGAKSICAGCPVRVECLEYAIRTREPHGIWGGLNELERRLLLRHRERERGLRLA
jgi:WhiB family transcriptional regulator, redox-sensing transcriptional regulator